MTRTTRRTREDRAQVSSAALTRAAAGEDSMAHVGPWGEGCVTTRKSCDLSEKCWRRGMVLEVTSQGLLVPQIL